MYGVPHTNDPNHPLFQNLRTAFTEAAPDILYIEGYEVINVTEGKKKAREAFSSETEEQTIREGGEHHFMARLALENDIFVESPELSENEEIQLLKKRGYSMDAIFTYYFNRMLAQFFRRHEHPTRDEAVMYQKSFISSFLEHCTQEDLNELDALPDALLANLDVEKATQYIDSVDPVAWENTTESESNRIARSLGDIRDHHILARTQAGVEHSDTLFIVYGSCHAVRLEPALKELVSTPGMQL